MEIGPLATGPERNESSGAEFARHFGGGPELSVRAPGRVNLIGEHTDYHEGYVLPMAIDRGIVLHGRPRRDRRVRAYSSTIGSAVELDLDALAQAPEHRHPEQWARFLQAVAAVLGARHPLRWGCDVLIGGNLAMGGGLSSSSALVVGFTRLLAKVQGVDLEPGELAQLGCDAEHWYGTTGGIMDQFVISHGKEGHAIFLDCRSLAYRRVPLPEGITVVIASTGIAHDQIHSPFATRRRQAEAGLQVIQSHDPEVRTLRDVYPQQLEELRAALDAADPSGVLWRRCRHVSTENARVIELVAALADGHLPKIGRLLAASQASLRDDYEVSCPELDAMVEAAEQHSACIGARLTGAGFGGCTVNLVKTGAVEDFCQSVAATYARTTGIDAEIYAVAASDGVTITVEPEA